MRALITGITGFAGSHLAEHLLECGDEVVGCSRHGQWDSGLPSTLQRIPLFPCDFGQDGANALRLHAAEFAPQAIYHLAAKSIPADCGRAEPTPEALAANVDSTEAVIAFALSLPQPPRLLVVSSSYVYGRIDPQNPRVNEDFPLAPEQGYGKTKLLSEQRALDAVRNRGLDAVIARSFQHAGPRQNRRMMLSEWAWQLARGGQQPVRVICLDAYLDLTDVRDIVRAYPLLVLHGESGTAYNVGSGICRRSGDIFFQLKHLAGSEQPVSELSPGRRQQPIADITRLHNQTGWRPEIPLEQTLADTLQYWNSHKSEVRGSN